MTTDIHRLLDEAFAGIPMTPAVQDLKEEIRANLVARVTELIAAGTAPQQADRLAIGELGDIADIIEGAASGDIPRAASGIAAAGTVPPGMTPPGPTGATSAAERMADWVRTNRVRPSPAFVLRTLTWSILLGLGLALAVLGATGALPLPLGPVIGLLGAGATGTGLLVGDSLSQETTANYPMPQPRAACYALSTWLAVFGLGLAGLIAGQVLPVWCLVFALLAVIGSIVGFVMLGVTQTNRHKAWTRAIRRDLAPNRFEQEPEIAARFGIFTGAIWILAVGTGAVLALTVGWRWVPLPFIAGVAAMLITLATMLFPARRR